VVAGCSPSNSQLCEIILPEGKDLEDESGFFCLIHEIIYQKLDRQEIHQVTNLVSKVVVNQKGWPPQGSHDPVHQQKPNFSSHKAQIGRRAVIRNEGLCHQCIVGDGAIQDRIITRFGIR
jgi:hypothetical protein